MAKQGVERYFVVCLIPTPFSLRCGAQCIFTGMGILACIILQTINKKARTKPIVYGFKNASRHFQCLALYISYINLDASILLYIIVHRMGNSIISIL